MTKEELEEKIKNNERVYDYLCLKEIKLNSNFKVTLETHSNQLHLLNIKERQFYCPIDDLFSTKAQAQHYLDNSNVTRTEKLPYITWEEVNQHTDDDFYIDFIDFNNNECSIECSKEFNSIAVFQDNWLFRDCKYEYTEENFYKAYEVCRNLFLGGENEIL